MDKKQKKQLLKRRDGLLKDIEEHEEKRKTELGNKDTTLRYWSKEIETKRKILEEIDRKLKGD